ncbi:Zonadhesin [Tupaia chinensis]|uniref:Erythropoietin n=1 Tax=Tupaia chinensis TaxID=246437 RepID=L9K1D8_TUPCH|nr:Zonadhesin [Tupaia chinensis]
MGVRGCPALPLLLLLLLSLVLLPPGLPVLGAPARLICDSRVLERYILEAKEAENVTMGCAEDGSLSENITVPDTKVNFYVWKRMEVSQQAVEVWQGLALLSEAIQRGQALLANSSQPSETLQLHVDKAVSGLRSLTSLLRALGAQKEAMSPPDAASAAPLRTFTVDTLCKLFRIYSNFLRGKLKLYTGEACRRGDSILRRVPVWTLVLLVGAAWSQGCMPAPIRPHSGLFLSAILTECNFEDDAKPLCDWSQMSEDNGDWIRVNGSSPNGTTGPPGGYPDGEGNYLQMEPNSFQEGEVARLRSPDLWEQGPLCVRFAYHMFGLSWGSQLRLLLLPGTQGGRPTVLWKHVNTQSPSWVPTTVTVPARLALPRRLVFEGMRGSTAYLDIALDALSILRGTCNQVCMMQTCNFDTSNDLCGWSWIPTASGAKWTQKKGSSGQTGVGPDDDFSSPGSGFYMLLDPKNAKPGQKSALLSPLSQSRGCLTLSFHYILRGQSPGAALNVYASVFGSIRKHILFSGQPAPNWKPVSVNFTAQGQIQFTVEGVFGKVPEPAVAVDAISIAPCGESFPQCNFEDDAQPFCDWLQTSEGGGRWTRGSKNIPIHAKGPSGESPDGEGHYIYLEADKFSQPGQSVKLVSRPFCAPGDICVEFSYHMYGLGEGTTLNLLLGSPAGSSPISLWNCVGSQSPDWLNRTITIPSGHQQPMQLIFEAIRGSNSAFVVAVGFILINQGPCRESCPQFSHYKSCACLATCENPKPKCGPVCRPGCVCNPGFLFSDNRCIRAFSCKCFYNNNYYEPGAEWFSPNCTERCHCWLRSQIKCQVSQCGERTVCQLKDGQYGCYPYGTGTCLAYGDLHYFTFDGRHFGFLGKCTYILAQTCGNSTDPFFRVTAKNEEQGQEGVSCLSKIHVTLPETTITLLKGRRTLVGGQQVTLPATPSKGVFLSPSGRFVELQTAFGLRVRWDGQQLLMVTVSSTYSGKLCGLCGNYDGNSNNDNLKSDGKPARKEEELGSSWQTVDDEDRDNCLLDMCHFQGLQLMLCAHMSAMTAVCQDAGYAVKPWRGAQFCPLACPPNSKYSLCAKPCPDTCHSGFSGMSCPDQCMEACECNPGFVLSGLECVPRSQCGCIEPGGYFKLGAQWFKPGCHQLCVCDGNNRIHCRPWRCKTHEVCEQKDGFYGCHPQGTATCTASGDPHYLTFDGALHHFMGTCTYILSRPCWTTSLENYTVSATNENRGGNLEVSYVSAVHVQVFNHKISVLRGRKVVLNGHQKALPLWPAGGQVTVRLSGSFVVLYTNFGLQVRYDGIHLLEVTVPSSYAGQLCGLCGNYNNNSLDDNLLPDRNPAGSSLQLGAAWKSSDTVEPSCFLMEGRPSNCQKNNMAGTWNKNCEVLMSPLGPFSQCHQVVPPQASFASCVHSQCGTKGDTLALCRSLQAYASLCAQAGLALTWRNSTFCPLRCPSGSIYSPCVKPCPATCLSLNTPQECPPALLCAEGCECQKGLILSGTACVPFSHCGCTDPGGSYHLVGESWYTEKTCSRLCTCNVNNNITCSQTTCKGRRMCLSHEGLLSCRHSGMGMCRVSGGSQLMSFDGSNHPLQGTCTHIMAKVCNPNMALPFFKISAKNEKCEGGSKASCLRQVFVNIYDSKITLQKGHPVLINDTPVSLPATSQIPRVSITSNGIYTTVNIRVCGLCGNFNDEEEDELMMPSDDLAQDDSEFVSSWKDEDIDPNTYTTCLPSCSPSCWDLNGRCEGVEVPSTCAEGCICQPGYVLNEDKCVPRSECGCKDTQGGSMSTGETWISSGCAKSCACTGGAIECQAFHCPPRSHCQRSSDNGSDNCVPDSLDQCYVFGDPHYYTFDHFSYRFQGRMTYILIKTVDMLPKGVERLVVEGRNKMNPAGKMALLHEVIATVYGYKVQLLANLDLVVNNQKMAIPYRPNEHLRVTLRGNQLYLVTDFKLMVSFSRRNSAVISLPSTYQGLVRGLCGNYDKNRENELILPSGILTQNLNTFTESWEVKIEDSLVRFPRALQEENEGGETGSPEPECSPEQLALINSTQACRVLLDPQGPFAACHQTVSPEPFQEHCVFGLCAARDPKEQEELRCWVLSGYAIICQEAGATLVSWRNHTGCALACPANTVYQSCMTPCPASCANLVAPEDCEGPCIEGCANIPGYVDSGTQSIPLTNCGCTSNGIYYQMGDSFVAEDCSQRCTCARPGTLLCEPFGCSTGETCALGNLTRGCFQESPCLPNPCQNEGRCREQGASFTCECDLGYGGDLCSEPQDVPPPGMPATASITRFGMGVGGPGRRAESTRAENQNFSLFLFQMGDSFVAEDCSQRCTCARPGTLLCEPFGCSTGETCALGNLTRGCFQESPCLPNPCQNEGRCREQGASFTCECDLGYGGDLCSEPQDVPPPGMPANADSLSHCLETNPSCKHLAHICSFILLDPPNPACAPTPSSECHEARL